MISQEQNQELRQLFALFLKKLNGYIKSIGSRGEQSNEVNEESLPYFSQTLDMDSLLENELDHEGDAE